MDLAAGDEGVLLLTSLTMTVVRAFDASIIPLSVVLTCSPAPPAA